jgi:hypothetical protein
MSGGVLPKLTFGEAEAIGADLHDHLVRMTGASPFERGDLGLADTVQFIARKARERVEQREKI